MVQDIIVPNQYIIKVHSLEMFPNFSDFFWQGFATGSDQRIDVLMCENDALALGAIDLARSEFGLRVPDDLAVVGYDGNDLAAAPAFDLTTYQQPMEEMVAALVDMLMGRREVESMNIRGKLIIRGST